MKTFVLSVDRVRYMYTVLAYLTVRPSADDGGSNLLYVSSVSSI